MLIEQLCREIRERLQMHRCRHKACDCYLARGLLAILENLINMSNSPYTGESKREKEGN